MPQRVMNNPIKEVSAAVLNEIHNAIDDRAFDAMFSSGGFELKSLANGRANFVADSESNAVMISSGYKDIIKTALKTVTQSEYEIEITDTVTFARRKSAIEKADARFFQNSHISPDHTFENFVTGPFNKLAYQASLFAVERPGMSNPIFLYSESGMGKTHLLHAIGNAYLSRYPDSNVLYITTDDFVNEFVRFITGSKESESLKDFFSTIDLLLVDDIQFLAGKEETQVMFFNVFNLLYSQRKQIILTSDKAPTELKGLQDRLVSRFAGGLAVSISNPDKNTLIEILKMKIKSNNLSLDMFDPKVLEYLSFNYSKNVRVLEGALTRLLFAVTVQKVTDKITLAFTKTVFEEDEVKKAKKGKVDIDLVIDSVSEYYSLTSAQLKSKVRTSQIALARQIAMYLARTLLNLPYQEIGKAFGKDHTTVLANVQKIGGLIKADPNLNKAIDDITARINNTK